MENCPKALYEDHRGVASPSDLHPEWFIMLLRPTKIRLASVSTGAGEYDVLSSFV